MTRNNIPWRILVLGIVLCTLLWGCATRASQPASISEIPEADDSAGWWDIRFKVNWPDDESPAWHVDLVLAHRIISPALEKYRNHITLWRFHRRAIRDATGHQFTFLFYSSRRTAHDISYMVASNPDLNALKEAGVIVQETYDTSRDYLKTGIEETSDTNWSLPVQKSWPYFIMGTSEMWLQLIASLAEETPVLEPPSTAQKILTHYEKISNAVTRTWHEEGGHAFLHHLNAIFGYEDVVVYERRRMTF